jgi:hypothetical protein
VPLRSESVVEPASQFLPIPGSLVRSENSAHSQHSTRLALILGFLYVAGFFRALVYTLVRDKNMSYTVSSVTGSQRQKSTQSKANHF